MDAIELTLVDASYQGDLRRNGRKFNAFCILSYIADGLDFSWAIWHMPRQTSSINLTNRRVIMSAGGGDWRTAH